jgi:hypothetical protein
VREKHDAQLFTIDDVGGPPQNIDSQNAEPPKKRRKPLRVDEILGTVPTDPQSRPSIPSHNSKTRRKNPFKLPEPVEEKSSYDVWTRVVEVAAPKDLPPPAILPYSKSKPAKAPSTIRSTAHLLRPRDKVKSVKVAEAGQSYNPTLEDWEGLIHRTAEEEEERLAKIAQKEWVAQAEEAETPAAVDEENTDGEGEKGESFLGRPVQIRRKTTAQRNKQARQAEMVLYTLIPETGTNTFRNDYVRLSSRDGNRFRISTRL